MLFQTEPPNQTHSKSEFFFKKPNQKQTDIKKSIQHILTAVNYKL